MVCASVKLKYSITNWMYMYTNSAYYIFHVFPSPVNMVRQAALNTTLKSLLVFCRKFFSEVHLCHTVCSNVELRLHFPFKNKQVLMCVQLSLIKVETLTDFKMYVIILTLMLSGKIVWILDATREPNSFILWF